MSLKEVFMNDSNEAKTLSYVNFALGVFTLFFNPFFIGTVLTILLFFYLKRKYSIQTIWMFIGLVCSVFAAFIMLLHLLKVNGM